jgi:cellulose synthase/poly-beta-1,6-N-acetylglucosamine synthase-like glycosyltransferase
MILLYLFASLISNIPKCSVDEENKKIENVSIQLHICNENIYDKVIKSSIEIDWPIQNLHIQVLDDSKDLDIIKNIKELVNSYKLKGFNIEYIERKNKTEGYKAGNLNNGILELDEKYEYIAIFDADFEIPK